MIEIYTDGASQGNPGPSGAGIYIQSGTEILSRSIPLPEMSNHEAEFHAVKHALDICKEHFSGEILSFRTDSKIVVDSVEKEYAKNKNFAPIVCDILRLTESFPYVFFKWIPEKQNISADWLARKAIQDSKYQ
ncbi:MAG TPA: reverse transcriptase-like protein [Virgibacillus sp.]|nr:reverse transcriptase-like protein [Virgibacillus sp.]